jgi:hypothetical protein
MIVPDYPKRKVEKYFQEISDFRGGTNTLMNERRLDSKFAVESTNLMQVQDGVWKTRPGVDYYGGEIEGVDNIDGATEYIDSDGDRHIVAIAGGKGWVSSDSAKTWTEITGATFTEGKVPFFYQTLNRLYVATGHDSLAFYDGEKFNTYTALAEPNAPTGVRGTGLSAGSFKNYYRVVAVNDIGYTAASNALEVTTNIHRDAWTDPDTMYIDLTITAVTGASGYQVYWGEFSGEEVYLGSTTTTTFKDDGTYEPNIYIETPDDNTTAAPKFRVMEVSGNRLWGTYDPNNPYRVYFSGVGQDMARFSPFYGGGYIDLERGGRNKPINVVHYRDGRGNPAVTVLCTSPDGKGTIFQIEIGTISIADTLILLPAAYKIVGSIGADAPYGVTKAGDNIFFLNKTGVFVLRNKEQMYNVLATDDLSAPIRNSFENLNGAKVDSFVAYYKSPVVYFSVSVGSRNDRTILFDIERGNWTWAWNIGFRQMFEHTDDNDKTKLLCVPHTGNKLVEISQNIKGDFGSAFYQSYISPILPVSKDFKDRAKIKEVVFELGNFTGTLTLEVLGVQKNNSVVQLATVEALATTTGTSGWSDEYFSDEPVLGEATDIPKTFAEPTTKKRVRVGEKVYAVQFKAQSRERDTNFTLLGVQASGTLVPGKAPSTWTS